MAKARKEANNEGDPSVADIVIPCYGGPNDGAYFPQTKPPLGYRKFQVRGRIVYLWRMIKVERLDFTTLDRASRMLPSAFDEPDTEVDEEHA